MDKMKHNFLFLVEFSSNHELLPYFHTSMLHITYTISYKHDIQVKGH